MHCLELCTFEFGEKWCDYPALALQNLEADCYSFALQMQGKSLGTCAKFVPLEQRNRSSGNGDVQVQANFRDQTNYVSTFYSDSLM